MRKTLTSKYLFTLIVMALFVSWAGMALDTDDDAFSFSDASMDIILPDVPMEYVPQFYGYLHQPAESFPGSSVSFLALHEKSPPFQAFAR